MSNNMKIRLFTVPNMLTLANLLAGCAAIIFTLQYHAYETAFWLIIAAAVFDFFDGFAARLLKQQSELGVQLDSLADDISFGRALQDDRRWTLQVLPQGYRGRRTSPDSRKVSLSYD